MINKLTRKDISQEAIRLLEKKVRLVFQEGFMLYVPNALRLNLDTLSLEHKDELLEKLEEFLQAGITNIMVYKNDKLSCN